MMSEDAIVGGPGHAAKCSLAAEVVRISGRLRLRVLGGSMLPALWPGDVVDIRAVPFAELLPGEIAVFHRDSRVWAHRVVENNGAALLTRGDAVPQDDPPVLPEHLMGRVVSIQRGRSRIVPAAALTRFQRLLRFLLYRSDFFRAVVLRLHALRIGAVRAPIEDAVCQ
ncbi:MAG: S26 family signal peptidase [Bryobacteraceae bacterium]|jgi:signal peptidase